MWYIISTIISIIIILILTIISIFIDYKNVKTINILIITLTSLLTTLSVILTNIIGYNIYLINKNIKLAIGDYIIFVLGMLFGPLIGILGAIAIDLLGILVNNIGIFHLGFILNKILYGFFGSLVFIFKKNKFWYIRAIIFYIIIFVIISFILDTIWLYSIGWNQIIVKSSFIFKLFKLPIVMIIYIPLMLTTFIILYKFLLFRHNIYFWAIKNGIINIRKKI